MKNTIDISQAPAWFDVQEPEERKYFGLPFTGNYCLPKCFPGIASPCVVVFDTEEAAYEGAKFQGIPGKVRVCKKSQIDHAIRQAYGPGEVVTVLNAAFEVLESWEVA